MKLGIEATEEVAVLSGETSDVESLASWQDTAYSFPSKSLPIGNGPHAVISDVPGDGWTIRYSECDGEEFIVSPILLGAIEEAKVVEAEKQTEVQKKMVRVAVKTVSIVDTTVEVPIEESPIVGEVGDEVIP